MGEAFAFFCWARLEYPWFMSAGHHQPTFNIGALNEWRRTHAVTDQP